MLEPVSGKVDMIVANLPYVKTPDLPNSEPVNCEPTNALNGGPDGLDKIRQLIIQAGSKLSPDGYVLTEIGQGQSKALNRYIRNTFPDAYISLHKDLAGIERVMELRLTKDSP